LRSSQKIAALLLSICLLLVADNGWALSDEDLMAMSLEELTSLQVTSISRKLQTVSESAAAVFVITREDIRRSGVTSIPEALRMAPGLSVARMDGSKWAVASRGFNGRFLNKMQVLIDGRSVYSPPFSNTFWDMQDTLLDDIERIEVTRGPGGTLWGANAVNGVINVITRNTRDTQGVLVKSGYGTEEEGFAALRYGGKSGDQAWYRGYVKYFNRGPLQDHGLGEANDDWNAFRGGFRLDATPGGRDEFTLQGEAFSGTAGQQDRLWVLNPAPGTIFDYMNHQVSDTRFGGGHLLARWQHQLADGGDFALQAYYDRSYRDEQVLMKEVWDVFDVDFQHRFFLGERHELLWGAGYRLITDDIEDGELISFDDGSRSDQLFSFFVQDEISLVPEKLRLLIGSKFEHNDYTGFEYQPNIRLVWTPDKRHTLWGAVSRAVRTPSRMENNADIFYGIAPPDFIFPGPWPKKLVVLGSEDFKAEKSLSYELGYRFRPIPRISFDTALFYSRYWDHRSGEFTSYTPQPDPPVPHFVITQVEGNKLQAETYGLEVTADWHALSWWRLQGTYSLLKVNTWLESDSSDILSAMVLETSSPQQQASLRSSFDLGRDWELDLWLRYVDRISIYVAEADDYISLDMRLAWRPSAGLELALVGQNLLEDSREEFHAEFGTVSTEVPRGFYLQATWQY